MYQPVNHTVGGVKARDDVANKAWIAALVKKPDGMGDKVGGLQEPRLAHRREIRDVGEIVDGAPCRAPLMETSDPELRPRVEPAF